MAVTDRGGFLPLSFLVVQRPAGQTACPPKAHTRSPRSPRTRELRQQRLHAGSRASAPFSHRSLRKKTPARRGCFLPDQRERTETANASLSARQPPSFGGLNLRVRRHREPKPAIVVPSESISTRGDVLRPNVRVRARVLVPHWLATAVAPNTITGEVSGASILDCARHGCNRYPTPKTVSMYASP
jgi:hypothetical protein